MRLLWVWVVVWWFYGVTAVEAKFHPQEKVPVKKAAVVAAVTEAEVVFVEMEAEVEEEDGCGRGAELCREGFFFTAVSLNEGRRDGVLEVLLSVEDSLQSNVTFDLSVRSKRKEEEEKVFAREEVTLEVNELRRVVLRVSELPWETAYFILKAHSGVPGRMFNQSGVKRLSYHPDGQTSTVKVSVWTEESKYAPGDTVNYIVEVFDRTVDKTPKFAQIVFTRPFSSSEETQLPWVEVPPSGILRGNFTFEFYTEVRVCVTSNVTSSVSIATTSTTVDERDPMEIMSVGLEAPSEVYWSQPRVKGRLTLTSSEGHPLEGHCNVTVRRNHLWFFDAVANGTLVRSVAVGPAGREFEFDAVEELGADLFGGNERIFLQVMATCSHLLSGIVKEATQTIYFYRSVFKVNLLSVGGPLRRGNSSHPKWTIVLSFLVERNDGGYLEVEPSRRLQVQLLLSEDNLKRLRPSATNFSLPIPEDGVVRLEFEVSDLPPSPWNDSVRLEVGDAVKVQSLGATKPCDSPTLQLSTVNKSQLIRRGDVVQLRVRSCRPFRNLNSVLLSSKAIYSSHRTSFSSEEEGRRLIDEVIELRVPPNVTEDSLIFMVYGIRANQGSATIQGRYSTDSAAVNVNVVVAERHPQVKIIDQVDADMSTTVTFRVEGILVDSIVTLHALRLTTANEIKYRNSLKKINVAGSPFDPDDRRISVLNNSPEEMEIDRWHIDMNANLMIGREYERHTSRVFLDFNKMTSTDDNGTFEVTHTFDRLTHFGSNVVIGASFTPEFGYSWFSNIPTLTILPPPVTLSVFVPPSVILGETFEVIGYIKNNMATTFESQVTLDLSEGGSTKVTEHQVEVKPSSVGILKMEVTPRYIGDLFLSLRSNISRRLTATQKVRVNSPGEVLKVAKHFIVSEKRGSSNGTFRLGPPTFELPTNCTPSGEAAQTVFQGDILGDISTFVNEDQFHSAFHIPGAFLSHAKVLLSMAKFYDTKKDHKLRWKALIRLGQLKTYYWISQSVPSPDIFSRIKIQGTKFVGLNGQLRFDLSDDWLKLKSMKRIGGSLKAILTSQGTSSSEETSDDDSLKIHKRATTLNSVDWLNFGVIIDTALALFTINEYKGNEVHGQYLNFTPSDFKRGVELLRAKTVEGKVNDTFPISLVTFLVSQVDDEDAPTFFRKLESTASKDSDGIFWESKWNGKAWTDSLAPSVTATSYALMAYVNIRKLEEADDVARWLVSKKNVNGFYASYEETAAAVESLSKYASFYAAVKGEWPSLVKVTKECVTPRRIASTEKDFTIQALTKNDGGTLHLNVCSKESNLSRLIIMEVSQPSGYKNCVSDTFLVHRILYLKPSECKYLEYCRMYMVYEGNSKEKTFPRHQ